MATLTATGRKKTYTASTAMHQGQEQRVPITCSGNKLNEAKGCSKNASNKRNF